jgi:hypothetical protein
MFRKLNFISTAFALLTLVFVCAVANAQTQSRPSATPAPTPTPAPQNQTIVNTSKSNVKDRVAPVTEAGGAKGWDGKVQGNLLVTPLVVTFENADDYDNFAAGRLRLNLILKNTLSGQTIRLDSRQLTEGFRPASDKSRLTLNVVVDNMSAPLSEAACGEISPGAENTAEGVNITLSYSGCGSEPAQRPGGPIGGIIVKGGKNPGGNMNIVAGNTRIVTREAAAEMGREAGVIIISSSKGNGSPKAAGF